VAGFLWLSVYKLSRVVVKYKPASCHQF